MVRTTQENVLTTLADGTRVNAIKETTIHEDGRVSSQTIPVKPPRSSEYSSSSQRGVPTEPDVAERQAVTRAAQLAVTEERLREKLDALTALRDSTQAKLDDSNKQIDELNDPERERQISDWNMECQTHATTQFDANNKACDLQLEVEDLQRELDDTHTKLRVVQARIAGEPYDSNVDIGGEPTQERADELEQHEGDLRTQIGDLESKMESALAEKQTAADQWSETQTQIAGAEEQISRLSALEQKCAVQTENLTELNTAHAALEAKVKQAEADALAAKEEAMKLLREREKRLETQKNANAGQEQAEKERAQDESARQKQREDADKAEAERQAAADQRRQAMQEREAELSRKEAEERKHMEEELQEHQEFVDQALKDKLWRFEQPAPRSRAWEQPPAPEPVAPPVLKAPNKTKKNGGAKGNGVVGRATEIGVWLRSMRMTQYEEQFKSSGFRTLGDLIKAAEWMTEADLKELGVVLAHRKSILQCIRAVSRIVNNEPEDTSAVATTSMKTPRAAAQNCPSDDKLNESQKEVLSELFKAYAPTGELSEMGFGALCLEAMARSILTRDCLHVTACHVRRWVRNGELGSISSPVIHRLFEWIDVAHTGAIQLDCATSGISSLWGGSSDGWQYCKFITTGPHEELSEENASCFLEGLSQFLFDLYANVAALESCHLEANGVSDRQAAARLNELKKELSISKQARQTQAQVTVRVLGRGRMGELPAPYRRLDMLLKNMLSHDMKILHTPMSAPSTPRGGSKTGIPPTNRSKAKPEPTNRFNDTVSEMLQTKLKEIETERASRKGARESNQRVPSPRRRLTALSVKVRRNTGDLNGKAIECSGLTTPHLIADINKKLGFKFVRLYSLLGVEVDIHAVSRPMELVASAGDAFIPIEEPPPPIPDAILPPRGSAKDRKRINASPSRTRLAPKPLDETAPVKSRRSPSKIRKAPLPPESRGPVTPRNPEASSSESVARPSPLASQVPRSAIRWASEARLQPGEWSNSRNIRRNAVAGSY